MLALFSTQCEWGDIIAASRVLRCGKLVNGVQCIKLEEEIGKFLGVSADQVVTCGSGTDALVLTMECLGLGGKRREVIVPAVTFSATYEAVLRAGATPVVVDVDPGHLTPTVGQIASAVTPRTVGVIMVHIYGWPAPETFAIADLCLNKGLALIEDTAQSFGASINGSMLGTIGDAGAVSFYPTKPLGGIGDGGVVTFRDVSRANAARRRRNHGRDEHNVQSAPGYNSRLDEANAAVLRRRLEKYRLTLYHLRTLSASYDRCLGARTPSSNIKPAPYVYPFMADNRDEVRAHLSEAGIQSGVYYDPPVSGLPYVGADCPNARAAMKRQISLPCHRGMSLSDVTEVCGQLRHFHVSQ